MCKTTQKYKSFRAPTNNLAKFATQRSQYPHPEVATMSGTPKPAPL